MEKSVTILLVILALSMCGKGGNNRSGGGGVSIPAASALQRAVTLLRITELVLKIFEEEEKVFVRPKNFEGPVMVFYPVLFVEQHGVKNDLTLESVDEKIADILRQCTQEALDTGSSNDNQLRMHRVLCLEQRGFNENDKAYIRIKYPSYWS